jgi:hypothetical protein
VNAEAFIGIKVATEKDDDRIKLNKNPHPYIGQLISIFTKTDDNG